MRSTCHSSRYGMRHGTCIGKTMAEVEEEEEEEKRLRGWPISVVAVEGVVPNDDSSKTTRRNAREEHEVSNEKTSENSTEVTGCELGNAVARVIAEHTGLKPEEIVELHITGDSIWVIYGVRTGTTPEDIRTRTRRIDAETGTLITDRDGRF